METRARYIGVGLFLLAVIAAGFGFVYWLRGEGGFGSRTAYQVRFESSVSGLRPGSPVLFNGVPVGQVGDIRLDPAHPERVTATILVEPGTPVRTDTRVGVDFQGLMGAPAVSLRGGTPAAPLAGAQGAPGLLVASPEETADLSRTARDVLHRVETILDQNAEPLHGAITSINTFAGALARNSDRIDGIMEGLERLSGGGTPNAPTPVYDLTAPRDFPDLDKPPQGQLVVNDPSALVALDTQRILLRQPGKERLPLDNAQWSDSLPKLLQSTIVRTFENANYLGAVGRPLDNLTAEHQLVLDIRNFEVSLAPDPVATVEFSAKIIGEEGRIVGARVFQASAPVAALEPAGVVAALDQAFGKAASDLVLWTNEVL